MTVVDCVSDTTSAQFVEPSGLCSTLYPDIAYELSDGDVQSSLICVSSSTVVANPVTWSGASPANALTTPLNALVPNASVSYTHLTLPTILLV